MHTNLSHTHAEKCTYARTGKLVIRRLVNPFRALNVDDLCGFSCRQAENRNWPLFGFISKLSSNNMKYLKH